MPVKGAKKCGECGIYVLPESEHACPGFSSFQPPKPAEVAEQAAQPMLQATTVTTLDGPPEENGEPDPCPFCGGSGKVGGQVCLVCFGNGYAPDPALAAVTAGTPIPDAQEVQVAGIRSEAPAAPVLVNTVPLATPSGAEPAEQPEPVAIPAPAENATGGWGWWSCYEKQDQWLKMLTQVVEYPTPALVPHSDSALPVLNAALAKCGSSLTYLQAENGMLNGRAYALKEVLENAMAAAKARLDVPKTTTESAKEGLVFNDPEIGELLRDTQRRFIEIKTCITSQDGIIRAYSAAYDTISRLITSAEIEAGVSSNRTGG